MNENSPKRHQVVSEENNPAESDVKKIKVEEVPGILSSSANDEKKNYMKLFKVNATKLFEDETSFDEEGK